MARRSYMWPIRRLLDPRFADLSQRIWNARQAMHEEAAQTRTTVTSEVTQNVDSLVGEFAVANVESLNHVGSELRRFDDAIAEVAARFDALVETAAAAQADARLRERADGAELAQLDDVTAALLDYGESHRGFAAQAGLWFNPPLSLRHRAGAVEIGNVNERIVEVPFAYRALGNVPTGARVLDFGAAESQVALSLASLGYEVTALDLRQYPLEHPNLHRTASPLERYPAEPGSFDVALCISTVEHVGLGWYGEEAAVHTHADRAAMARLAELLVPGGLLVLTVPYGTASVTEVQRTYDAAGLDALLEGWEVSERELYAETAPQCWTRVDATDAHGVALVAARTPSA